MTCRLNRAAWRCCALLAPVLPLAAESATAADQPESLLELLIAGGWVMLPLALCSLLALGLALERFLALRRTVIVPDDFLPGLKTAVGDTHQPDTTAALRYCDERKEPVAEIFRAGLTRMNERPEIIEKAIEDAGLRQVSKMKRSLRPLSTIAAIAPLLGLLGTVYGMITAFQAAAGGAVNKADTLAAGIYTSLVTTAAGLTLAIPVLLVFHWLSTRVDNVVDSIDEQAIDFLEFAAYNQHHSERTATQSDRATEPTAAPELSPATA
ncbi:MAG: MotA/TolQ/ExbB proton channel family protein [Planctomycetota bacterium]